MKLKKRLDVLTITAFLAMLLLPFIFTNHAKDALSIKDNRMLPSFPRMESVTDQEFANAAEDYFSTRIGFRDFMISLNGFIDRRVFGKAPTAMERVIIGKEDWLFYDAEKADDGASISQYIGCDQYTEEELRTVADNILNAREYVYESGCKEFILFIAPNKERIYSEYMPDKYQRARISETNGTDQLVDWLRANTDIKIVYPYEDLMRYKHEHPNENLYFRLDTHWNELGGYIGTKALLEMLEFSVRPADEETHTALERPYGDLSGMISTVWTPKEPDTSWEFSNYYGRIAMTERDEQTGHWRFAAQDGDSRKLLMRRDSFAEAMGVFLGAAFNESDLLHAYHFDSKAILEEKPDVFVFEIVERYLEKLLEPGLGICPIDTER